MRLEQEAIGEVVQAYLVHAMSSGAAALVPQLACHLRAGRRHLSYAIFAEQLTARPLAESRTAFDEAAAWFDSWHGGDVLPTEMFIIADQVITSCLPILPRLGVIHKLKCEAV